MAHSPGGHQQTAGIPAVSRKPLYFVIYEATGVTPGEYNPLVDISAPDYLQSSTLPHLLDRDLIGVLPVLWYCLHLPATCFDLQSAPKSATKRMQGFDMGHGICISSFDRFQIHAAGYSHPIHKAALVFVDDKHFDAVKATVDSIGWEAELIRFSDLDPARLPDLWRRVAKIMGRDAEYQSFNRTVPFCDRLDIGPLIVPMNRLLTLKLLSPDTVSLPTKPEYVEMVLENGLRSHTYLAAVAALEVARCSEEEAAERIEAEFERQSYELRLPASVALPGLPSAYCNDRYPGRKHADFFREWVAFDTEDSFARLKGANLTDIASERAALEIAVTHRACATTGLGMVLDPVPATLFGQVAQMEQHWRAREIKPDYVWKMLNTIGTEMGGRLSPFQQAQLGRASQLTAFTNFPFGWTILPGDTAPLMCRVPIAYRPLLPLTRTLSSELAAPPICYLGHSIRVLLVEALPVGDKIRPASLESLKMIERDLQLGSNIVIKVEEIDSVEALRGAIRSFQPDMLLISTHGKHDLRRRTAGIAIGNNVCLGPELGPMPPVVILSACHVAPRSTGAVNIAELLLRQGAITVLGTQVPVSVTHNAILMSRFLIYVIESVRGNEPHATIAEAWHRAATSNAVNDIVGGDSKVIQWATSPVGGVTPLQDFMRTQSSGRLRLGHVYHDSEVVLQEIADRHQFGSELRSHIAKRRYLPETLFYLLLGWPDRIRLNDPVMRSMPQPSSDSLGLN